ncbi:hypothetical protein [Streptomyces mirabilis]|uniref:hypothetical protein n=1 Tax=Streptomyces mirabilis TaxID=68239 RepID=UPI0033F05541
MDGGGLPPDRLEYQLSATRRAASLACLLTEHQLAEWGVPFEAPAHAKAVRAEPAPGRGRNVPPGCVKLERIVDAGEQDPTEAIVEIRSIRETAEAEAGL